MVLSPDNNDSVDNERELNSLIIKDKKKKNYKNIYNTRPMTINL